MNEKNAYQSVRGWLCRQLETLCGSAQALHRGFLSGNAQEIHIWLGEPVVLSHSRLWVSGQVEPPHLFATFLLKQGHAESGFLARDSLGTHGALVCTPMCTCGASHDRNKDGEENEHCRWTFWRQSSITKCFIKSHHRVKHVRVHVANCQVFLSCLSLSRRVGLDA